ncbi:MAG TPA: hypothetical protein VN176_11010 [Verrucomicrobiae bacterium]|nr:hypothetical protein [Verrucomicrobiae bacterium]
MSIRCRHRKLSQPFAGRPPARRETNADWDTPTIATTHYVVCLDCGHKFGYDWVQMRIVGK